MRTIYLLRNWLQHVAFSALPFLAAFTVGTVVALVFLWDYHANPALLGALMKDLSACFHDIGMATKLGDITILQIVELGIGLMAMIMVLLTVIGMPLFFVAITFRATYWVVEYLANRRLNTGAEV